MAKNIDAAAARHGERLSKFGDAVQNPNKTIGEKIIDAVTVGPAIDFKLGVGMGPESGSLVASPFGNAYPILQKSLPSRNRAGATGQLNLYCVGCGTTGQVQVSGQAQWVVGTTGLKSATVAVKGSINARLVLGLDAKVDIEKEYISKNIFKQGIPKLDLKGIVLIGPSISLGVEASVGVSLQGQIQAGISMEIANFAANLDLKDGSKSITTGFEPKYTKIFDATAQLSATAAFGLPVGVAVGISIPALKKLKIKDLKTDYEATIFTKPSIEAQFNYITSSTGCPVDGNTCVNGVSTSLNC